MGASEITLLNNGKVKDWRKIASDTAHAVNNLVVHNTDDEIIGGVKTFTETINGTSDKALKDGDGNTISSTYLKSATTPLVSTTTEEPSSASTSSMPNGSVILWMDADEEEEEEPVEP